MKYFLILVITMSIYSNNVDEYFKESIIKREEMEIKAEEKLQDAEEKYLLNMESRFKAIDQIWGKHLESTPERYIEYALDNRVYASIDFEKGEIEFALIDLENKSLEENKTILTRSILDTLEKEVEVKKGKKVYLLDDQLPYEKDKRETYVYKLVDNLVKEPNEKGSVYKIKVDMLPNHLEKRAMNYKEIVSLNSEQFGIPKDIIYAIIHTESHFNPMAISHAGAYGLMQLIPSAGGKDAYGYLTGNYINPSPEYLFVPKNNITLGSAYLHILLKNNFKDVKDNENKMILALASYNWGIGNVQRRIEGVIDINNYSPKELISYIQNSSNIPKETKDYILHINSRRELYKNF